MTSADLACKKVNRREDLRGDQALYGLDYVEVSQDQLTLTVVLVGKAPPKLQKENIRISGGRSIRDIRVVALRLTPSGDPTLDDSMEVTVDKSGDFSPYTLSVVQVDANGVVQPMPGFDPRYGEVSFSFRVSCPSDLDCKATPSCSPPQRAAPEINYLAKDYESFRQLMLDRLAQTLPDWQETHAADIGVALIELLAYVADYQSYYQDAVATEAYLGTARQRISVRRHARLVDYTISEGCNARAWVAIQSDKDFTVDASNPFYFVTSFAGAPQGGVLSPNDLLKAAPGSYEVFEPLLENPPQELRVFNAHNEINFYTWGDCQCCLPQGTVRATLADRWVQLSPTPLRAADPMEAPPPVDPSGMQRALNLSVGDILIFEEVLGPKTGNPADADPRLRQAVRLTKVTPGIDPLYPKNRLSSIPAQPIVEIEWCPQDALTFPLCISAQAPSPDCSCMENVSVARGNVILVDNGVTVAPPESLGSVPVQSSVSQCGDCGPTEIVTTPGPFHPKLKGTPLTFSEPLPPCGCASALIVQDPRQATPEVSLTDDKSASAWSPQPDLLESGPNDLAFVVEIDNGGIAHLRFGDGEMGQAPQAGAKFQAVYRVGNGPTGNVGAEAIAYLVLPHAQDVGNVSVRNPLPATGGTAPETIAQAKQFAPYALRDVLERAITAEDYATLAQENARRLRERPALEAAAQADDGDFPSVATGEDPRSSVEEEAETASLQAAEICVAPFTNLQRAKGVLRWNGSWYEARVAVDPLGSETADPELLAEIAAYLEPYRCIGHDLEVTPAVYAPLDLVLTICVLPQQLRGHVEAALLDVFSNRVLPDGRLGFFHPDNLTFGEDVYVSKIVAAAQAVPGVQSVKVTRLERYEIGEPPPGSEMPSEEVPPHSVLTLAPFEIAQLDNDPSFPENGRLTLDLRGGR